MARSRRCGHDIEGLRTRIITLSLFYGSSGILITNWIWTLLGWFAFSISPHGNAPEREENKQLAAQDSARLERAEDIFYAVCGTLFAFTKLMLLVVDLMRTCFALAPERNPRANIHDIQCILISGTRQKSTALIPNSRKLVRSHISQMNRFP